MTFVRNIAVLLFLFNTELLFAQHDTAWYRSVDTLSYKVFYSKKHVSREIISAVGLRKKFIANPNQKFRPGCTGNGKKIRLNWIAEDKQGHYIMSISYGGIAYRTYYYFVESNTYDLNAMTLRIPGQMNPFWAVVEKIKANDYSIIDNGL